MNIDMESQAAPNPPGDPTTGSLRAMETDLRFIRFLLETPIYQGRSPNLFERLRHYARQAGEWESELALLDPSREGDFSGFQSRFWGWKAEVFEYLQSQLQPG